MADDLTKLIERSAAPETVTVAIDRLRDAEKSTVGALAEDGSLRQAVVAVTAASRSLTELLLADPRAALAILGDLGTRPPCEAGDVESLRRWKRLEFLRIAARDLLGIDSLEQVGAALAAMASEVLDAASRLAGARELAVIGMGKLGGNELNYASDVDVLLVGGNDRMARAVMDVARQCFRVDADLRPEGRNGALTRSLESYEAYWDRWAEPWEFQALLKAAPVGGDDDLGARFCAAAAARVWDRRFTAEDLHSLRHMKARSEDAVARKGLSDREVKRGRGGIRDIEFSIQLLQLVHGRHDPGLRSPNTRDALAELSAAGYVDPADAGALEDAWRFLRTVEHRLQLVDEQQVHAVPADETARARLARVMGYRDGPDATAVERLDDQLRRHQATARSIHERLFFRPLLEVFAGSETRLGPEAAEERLAAFGFTDAERTRQALRELTRGLTRSSRLMRQLLPLLLDWLSEAPDPDLGLLGLRTLASGSQRGTELVTAFRESTEAARRLCLLLGTSRILLNALEHNPDLAASLGDDRFLASRDRDRLVRAGAEALAWREESDRSAALQRLQRREFVRIAAADVLGLAGVEPTGAALSDLAEATLESALAVLAPPVPFAVVAMGRFGGAELSYASDLDVLFVYDGSNPSDFEAAERTAEALMRFMNGRTPAQRIYEVDADLRPEGKQGPLARSLDAFRTYYDRWVAEWELQALVRARPVAGSADVGARFMELVEPYVWRDPFPEDAVREIRRMKARVERERIPTGDDPQFHLKLGRGSLSDVEWTVQLLQLQHGLHGQGTMSALEALREQGLVEDGDAEVLADAYRFCERTRNRWYLVKGSRGDALPSQPEQLGRLARSLGMTAAELRERYRRVTRRARHVTERLFYGRADAP